MADVLQPQMPPGVTAAAAGPRRRRVYFPAPLICLLITLLVMLSLKVLSAVSENVSLAARQLKEDEEEGLLSPTEFPQLIHLFDSPAKAANTTSSSSSPTPPSSAVSLTFYGSYELTSVSVGAVASSSSADETGLLIGDEDSAAPVVTFLREGGGVAVPTDPDKATIPPGEIIAHEKGRIRILLLSRPSVFPEVRLAVARLELESVKDSSPMRVIRLSGLNLEALSSVTLQGVARPRALKLSSENFPRHHTCRVAGSLRLRQQLAAASSRDVTLRPMDTTGTRWGLDDSEFGLGGSWDGSRRRRLQLPPSNEEKNEAKIEAKIEAKNEAVAVNDDIWGSVISQDCGVRIWVTAKEVNLAELSSGVVGFVILFVAKSLGEMRAFFAQVRHTEWPGSPLRMSYASLALHVCVDCFDVIVLLGQAANSNFMASAFVLLAVLKLLFVSAVQLRFLVLVVRTRLAAETPGGGNALSARLSRFVKLHAAGTALLLIGALEGLSLWPGFVSLLFLFWLPQIALDAIAGNRKALSLEYLFGMSIWRLVLPLYLWGFPGSVFDGRVLRRPPGAPSMTVCGLLIGVVGAQVAVAVAQQRLGPRWFIPHFCLPRQYDYHRQLPANTIGASSGVTECVICMSELDPTKRPRSVAVTPCNHLFHDTCLLRWLDVKPECPTCRGPLPPFI